ncbi:MAG TPA: tetratricopeptide repeat protein [Candidatus Eisenbacteria bacterium]|nr:tetratricopeptide repeat protein [Candidatus Eisenbacteria bacterium]
MIDARQFDTAIARLRDRVAHDPADREARSLLARVLSWQRRFDESFAEYERLLSDQPEDTVERSRYALVLTWSGAIERSLAEFRRALETDSSNVETRIAYARALSWTGDLPGASMEFKRVLVAHPSQGDAWLGYATVARWRSGATASDRFLTRAEANGAEPSAATEERTAVRHALAPSLGAGWTNARERQYLDGPDYTMENSGPFMSSRLTVGRTADVTVHAAWLDQFERDETGALAYDLDMRQVRADLALLRAYPFQLSGGLESRTVKAGLSGAAYPLLGTGDFVGWKVQSWAFLGRFTPSAGAWRDFVPVKRTGPNELVIGHQTVSEGKLAWQWSGRGSVDAGVQRGRYSDGNRRSTVQAGSEYRLRGRTPIATVDYRVGYSDFDQTSASYFTPLKSVRQAAGFGVSGYRELSSVGWGARYEFSYLSSDNFEPIRTNALSGYLNAAAIGPVGMGVEATYSRDNHAYEIWSIGLHAAARW